jgi:prephenate dehydrogenase
MHGAVLQAGSSGRFPLDRVAVLGVGMIGGSLAAALRAQALAREVVGYSPSADGALALERGLIDRLATDPRQAVQGASLVLICAPIPAIAGLLSQIAPHLGAATVVSDCASTKQSVIAAARDALGERFARFVAAHPIAGSERSGALAARADLFAKARLMLCPQNETDLEALELVSDLWKGLGAEPIVMSAAAHDQMYALVSHWPHAVAFALSASVGADAGAELALKFAGAGLRDTTRIGASSPELWADILLDNRRASLECANRFQQEIDAIVKALEAGDRESLVGHLSRGSDWRKRLG